MGHKLRIVLTLFFLYAVVLYSCYRQLRTSHYENIRIVKSRMNESYRKIENGTDFGIFIAVRTSRKFFDLRLKVQLQTWMQLVKEGIFIFTDKSNETVSDFQGTDAKLVETNCGRSHGRTALNCKLQTAYNTYLNHSSCYSWFCHFDDDVYVNTRNLKIFLDKFNASENYYFGKPSLDRNFVAKDRINFLSTNNISSPFCRHKSRTDIEFRFAHGGSGWCLSRGLALAARERMEDSGYRDIGEAFRTTDDITLGLILLCLLNTNLTVVPEFRSSIESLSRLSREELKEQIVLGADFKNLNSTRRERFIELRGYFEIQEDLSRFLSLHTFLAVPS